MVQDHITPHRTANAMLQDTSTFYFLLVEGIKDLPTYKKLISEGVQIKVSFGKHKMKEIDELLKKRGFENYLGIRDADFLRLKNNSKFNQNYCGNIFATDEHDSESMIIASDALTDFINHISHESNTKTFSSQYGSIRDLCYRLCYPIACLRLASKKYDLGLAFKPLKPEGNKVKFKKFICEKEFIYLGHEKMINTLVEYSTNRGGNIPPREDILKALDKIISENYSLYDIVNGHDLSEVLYIICKKGLKIQNKLLSDAGCVEDMLRMTYNMEYFKRTKIYGDICDHQNKIQKPILRE